MEKQYVFVYGTLRKHERNHHLLKEAALVAEQAWTDGTLFDTGYGYPAVQESNTDNVYGELYFVTDEQLQRLDELEGYDQESENNLYNRKQQVVFHDSGKTKAYMYTIAEPNKGMLKKQIKTGDWKEYQLSKQDTILYFAYGSCLDDARFKLANVNQYFQTVTGRGILNGYTLRFTKRLADGGRADIVEEGGIVEGKVYKINQDCLSYLYKREGVHSRHYRPTFVDLIINEKLVKNVLTFTVVSKDQETAPPTHYSEEILRGGTGFLSETYMISLKEHITILCKQTKPS
jgi:gamma-glutamylcyclotransferase (GGCT)/AIG2-like uncharacterized protein YtfP